MRVNNGGTGGRCSCAPHPHGRELRGPTVPHHQALGKKCDQDNHGSVVRGSESVCLLACACEHVCVYLLLMSKSVSICIYGLVRLCHVCACMTVRSIASDWTGRSEREGETEKDKWTKII